MTATPELDHALPTGGGLLPGDLWEQAFWFTVPGQVVSKANYRNGDTRRSGAWSKVSGYELEIAAAARKYRPAGWDQGSSGPVASRPRFLVYCLARTMIDAGNLDKSILDALQGSVMLNDAQVGWSLSAVLRTDGDPGVTVSVARIQPDTPLPEQATAAAALIGAVTRRAVPLR